MKKTKYYGEVWFPDLENEKQFAIISFENDDLLIETNLYSQRGIYKELKILGSFSGLGHITFIDCKIKFSEAGLTETRIYNPRYSFISSYHFIDAVNTKIKEFTIVNKAIVNWIDIKPWYNTNEEKLFFEAIEDEYLIPEKQLAITISHTPLYQQKSNELRIKNTGKVSFKLENPISVMEAIDYYNQFQKVLQLLHGGSSKFERFGFKCINCDQWQQIYFNDKTLTKTTNPYIHTNYQDIKQDLDKIFNAVYSNESFIFCLDKLMENFITQQASYNKRFTNSIAAYEAFTKLLSNERNPKLAKAISNYKNTFMQIGQLSEEDWKLFPSKVVRSRDYHTHSNLGNKDVFSEYDLLYISFLFDFVIGYLLLETLNVSNELLQKFVKRGESVFIHMKKTNEILRTNPLRSNKK